MKIITNIIYYLFIAGIMALSLLLLISVVPIAGNLKAKIVKSGSMEPTIKTGGVVFITPRDTYVAGDVITFGKDTKTQIPTTHRIIEVNGDGPLRTFTTKGDANSAIDPVPTRLSDIKGRVVFSLPYLGYILDFAKKPVGFILLVGIPAGMVILDEIMKIVREVKLLKRKQITHVEPRIKRKIQ